MAGLSLRCHLCNAELRPNNYADWEIRNRKQITYACPPSHPPHAAIEMIHPDLEINYYSFLFQIKDQHYKLCSRGYSIIREADFPITVLYKVTVAKQGHTEPVSYTHLTLPTSDLV